MHGRRSGPITVLNAFDDGSIIAVETIVNNITATMTNYNNWASLWHKEMYSLCHYEARLSARPLWASRHLTIYDYGYDGAALCFESNERSRNRNHFDGRQPFKSTKTHRPSSQSSATTA
jgi:hypothetical protein